MSQVGPMHETISSLKRRLAALTPAASPFAGLFALGAEDVDAWLGGGLARGALHEILAPEAADMGAAACLAAAFAQLAAPRRTIGWVRQTYAQTEGGALHAPGWAALGLDPDALLLVRVRDPVSVLRAGHEAVRCAALGAVVIEIWKSPKALDFTATRRLALSAAKSGVTIFLLRASAMPRASAALTRWRAVSAPSVPLEANAPGHPCFDIALLRHRAGVPGKNWRLEWDRDRHIFRQTAPLSGAVVPISADGPPVAPPVRLVRTG